MFYVVFLCKKKADMSQEEFTDYWINKHTPLTAKTPGLREYKCFPLIGYPGEQPPYDAVAYIAFDSKEDHDKAMESPEFAAALADAPNFQTTEKTLAFWATGHQIV